MTTGWILTYTGRKFFPLDPDPSAIAIEDIAHALAHQCRYTGHASRFYSVAEHSVYVALRCSPKYALAGLLHDASEAYLCDIASPVKAAPEFAAYRAAEERLQGAILKRFGLSPVLPWEVLGVDARMIPTEARDLFETKHPDWDLSRYGAPYDFRVQCFQPHAAERAFLYRFEQLYAQGHA